MIYFVGDLHFGHSNILEYEKRHEESIGIQLKR